VIGQALSRQAVLDVATAWCRQTVDVEPGGFEPLLAEDVLVHGLDAGGGAIRGPQAVEAVFRGLWSVYPRKACHVVDAVVEDDKAVVRWTMTFCAGIGDWRATAGQVEGMTWFVVRNDKIAELWTNFGHWWV
jgi:hypothetical protein